MLRKNSLIGKSEIAVLKNENRPFLMSLFSRKSGSFHLTLFLCLTILAEFSEPVIVEKWRTLPSVHYDNGCDHAGVRLAVVAVGASCGKRMLIGLILAKQLTVELTTLITGDRVIG